MKNKNNSMDYLMLLHCINPTVRCDELLTMKHTDWSKKSRSSRCLCLDYSSPKDWDADKLKLRGVDIKALWQAGHRRARAKALEIDAAKSDQLIDSLSLLGYTLKRTFGKLIGVTEVHADVSVTDENEVDIVDGEEDESFPFADLITNEKKCQTIEVDGQNIYKATVVNQIFSKNKLSKDRLRQVQWLTAGTRGGESNNVDDNSLPPPPPNLKIIFLRGGDFF